MIRISGVGIITSNCLYMFFSVRCTAVKYFKKGFKFGILILLHADGEQKLKIRKKNTFETKQGAKTASCSGSSTFPKRPSSAILRWSACRGSLATRILLLHFWNKNTVMHTAGLEAGTHPTKTQ
jgi:hypothetical protein